MSTTFKQVHVIGKKGYFGEVTLSAVLNTSGQVTVSSTNSSIQSYWFAACQVGCQIFFERRGRTDIVRGLEVTIEGIRTAPVDTSTMEIIYSTIMALSKEVPHVRTIIDFDAESGKYTLL